MTDTRTIEFTKMQGTGNDFIVLDNRDYGFSRDELSERAARWCPRRFGVGADGLLALDDASSPEVDYRMLYVNADGSWATMCGNGARCLLRFARQNGFETSELAFETDDGRYRGVVSDPEVGPVRLFVPNVTQFESDVRVDRERPDGLAPLCYAHAGTEHLVAFVEDVESIPVEEWGEHLRHDPSVEPEGANVNFVRVSAGELEIRTYEKGVEAETLSCGTGVLAAVSAAERIGRVAEGGQVVVHTQGGSVHVGKVETNRGPERYLEGPAERVYRGLLEADLSP